MEDNKDIKSFLQLFEGKKGFKERESLPKSKEEFKKELDQAKYLKQGPMFQKTLDEINKFIEDKKNTMYSKGKAKQENWYELITCDEHLRLNYEILKQYAHYLARYSAERLIRKDNYNKIKSNLVFLKQAREICDLIFNGVMKKKAKDKKEEELQRKQEEKHQHFMKQIVAVINAIKAYKRSIQIQNIVP